MRRPAFPPRTSFTTSCQLRTLIGYALASPSISRPRTSSPGFHPLRRLFNGSENRIQYRGNSVPGSHSNQVAVGGAEFRSAFYCVEASSPDPGCRRRAGVVAASSGGRSAFSPPQADRHSRAQHKTQSCHAILPSNLIHTGENPGLLGRAYLRSAGVARR